MQQQQPYYPPPAPTPGIGYVNLILVGIILLMVSGVLFGLIYILDNADALDVVRMLGVIVNEVGLGIMAIGLVMGAFKDTNLHHHTRVAMLIAMGITIAYVHLKMVSLYTSYY